MFRSSIHSRSTEPKGEIIRDLEVAEPMTTPGRRQRSVVSVAERILTSFPCWMSTLAPVYQVKELESIVEATFVGN
jgi:hypothetical protein